MTTVQQVLTRFAEALPDAAVRLVRLHQGDERALKAAATAWCEAASQRSHLETRPGQHEAVWTLLDACGPLEGPWRAWLRLARGRNPSALADWFDAPLLDALLWLWPVRERQSEIPARLTQWAALTTQCPSGWGAPPQCGAGPGLAVAFSLLDYPDLAYGLLDAPRALHVATCPHAGARDALLLALQRRVLKLDPVPRDDEVLNAMTPDAVMAGGRVFELFRAAVAAGLPVRADIAAEAARGMTEPAGSKPWLVGVWLHAAQESTQQGLVELLARVWRHARDPAEAFSHIVDLRSYTARSFFDGPGWERARSALFAGPGWGRKRIAKKLLPVTRELLHRRIWPLEAWLKAVSTDRSEWGREHALIRVTQILAEGLLDRALDDNEDLPVRRAAIVAIVHLQPGGDGTVERALGKLIGTKLGPNAKAAQRQLRETRSGKVDRELALLDAWEHFVAEVPHAG